MYAADLLTLLLLPLAIWLALKFVTFAICKIFHKRFLTQTIQRKLFMPICTLAILAFLSRSDNVNYFFARFNLKSGAIFSPLIFAALAYVLSRGVKVVTAVLYRKFDISHEDNLRQRKIRTQLQYIQNIAVIGIWVMTIGFTLLSFEGMQKYGQSLLASAGLVGIIVGFAAQKSLANLVAGFQIAFTQPLRLDDAVVIEGEWGWVEEITLTYIVIKIWDQRRLVLPITYVIEKPFQNWTRTTAQILGTVYIYVNYETDIEALRVEFKRIVESTPLWDGQVQVLQVVELKQHHIELRGLVSAKNSPKAWDLRCYVREQVITYLQRTDSNIIPFYQVQFGPLEEGFRPSA